MFSIQSSVGDFASSQATTKMDNKCYSSASGGGDVSSLPSSTSPADAAVAASSSPANEESAAAPSGLPSHQLSWPFFFLTRQFPAMFAATSDAAAVAVSPKMGDHQLFTVTSASPSAMTSADVMAALQQQQQMTPTPRASSPQTANLPQCYSTLLQKQQQQFLLQQFLAKNATTNVPRLSSANGNNNNNAEDEQRKSNGFGNNNSGSTCSRASSARSDAGAAAAQQPQQSVQHALQFDMDGNAICPVCEARMGVEPREWNAHVRLEAQRLRMLIKSIGDSSAVQTAAASTSFASFTTTVGRLAEVRKRRELELQRIRLNQAKRRGQVKTLLTAAGGSVSSTSPSTSSCASTSSSSFASSMMTATAAAVKEASSGSAAAGGCLNDDRRLAANGAHSTATEGERSGAAVAAMTTSTKDGVGPFSNNNNDNNSNSNNNNNNNTNVYDGKCCECHRLADPLIVSTKNGGGAAARCWDCFHDRLRRHQEEAAHANESGTLPPPTTKTDEIESAQAEEQKEAEAEEQAAAKGVRATTTAARLAAIHNIDTLLLKKEEANRCRGDEEAAERRVDGEPPAATASSGRSAHTMADLFTATVGGDGSGGKRRRVM